MRWVFVMVIAVAACGSSADSFVDASSDAPAIADAPAAPTAAELMTRLASCHHVGGSYATDSGRAETIEICGLANTVYWTADLDVDCDGKTTTKCNASTDAAYQSQTSATDSHGKPLDAAALPYVVVPLPSTRFDYAAAGIALGSVVAVIYRDRVEYGVVGDEGPNTIIGEASYAMASALGIDPDPATGGVDTGVTYVAFTGASAVVAPIEDPAAARELGTAKAHALLGAP